jgi:hypothetical protein
MTRAAIGLSDEVRNGFTQIKAPFRVIGDAPEEKLREIVERAQARRPCSTWSPTAYRVECRLTATAPGPERIRPRSAIQKGEITRLELTATTGRAHDRRVAAAETAAGVRHDRDAAIPSGLRGAKRLLQGADSRQLGGLGVTSVQRAGGLQLARPRRRARRSASTCTSRT